MRDLYPGVDLQIYARNGQLEYDLLAAPGADLSQVALEVDGGESVTVQEDGHLAIRAAGGDLVQWAPVVHENTSEGERSVTARYRRLGSTRFGFELEGRDPTVPLVIDPVITYSTYFGGDGTEIIEVPQFDPNGYLYLQGLTTSVKIPALPVTAPRNLIARWEYDSFLVQLSPSGRTVLSWLYIGGRGSEFIEGFAFDSDGNLLIAGTTDGIDFPFLGIAKQPLVGEQDVWLAKVDPRRGEVLYATLFGGIWDEWVSGFGVDASGFAYLIGGTLSPDLPTARGFQLAAGGDLDCYAAKFRAADGQLVAATYFGGLASEWCHAVVVTPSHGIYVAGEVFEPGLPTTPGVFQGRYGGHTRNNIGDAFIARIDPGLGKLVYSSYLGGPHDEYALGLAVDDEGDAFVTGISFGPGFPLVNPLQTQRGRDEMAFVSKVNPSGSELLFSTYLGGSYSQYGVAATFDPRWGVVVAGLTNSRDFPVVDPVQARIRVDPATDDPSSYPPLDTFVTALAPTGDEILFSTYLGSTDLDGPTGVAVDPRGNLWIAGAAGSTGFPIVSALQPEATPTEFPLGFFSEAFLTKIERLDRKTTPAFITSPAFPDYRFAVSFLRPESGPIAGRELAGCPPETLCVSGALAGRTEVMIRMAGPKPNARTWPHLVTFSTSEVEVLVEQLSTGEKKIYRLPGASPADDRLPGLFDRRGFVPMSPSWNFGARAFGIRPQASPATSSLVFTSEHFPDFRFYVRISAGDQEQAVRKEVACIDETLCLSGAVPGRSEVFLRIVGPKPNGRLWPTIVKFTTSTLEVWVEQVSTGETKYYRIEGAAPGHDDLTGLFDRDGFAK